MIIWYLSWLFFLIFPFCALQNSHFYPAVYVPKTCDNIFLLLFGYRLYIFLLHLCCKFKEKPTILQQISDKI